LTATKTKSSSRAPSQGNKSSAHPKPKKRAGSQCIVVHPYFKVAQKTSGGLKIQDSDLVDNALEETIRLAQAISLSVDHAESVGLSQKRPSTFIGKGVVDRLQTMVSGAEDSKHPVEVVVIDTQLSPIQQRNLENAIGTKVIDRTALILEIFGERARTHEGRLQVELAANEYQKSRLVRSWTHLERQRGGAGFMGGPGERQLEIDRRLLADRIKKLKGELAKVRQTREINRNSKFRQNYPIIALVGYTNAGKSTLFNKLSGANILAKDQLFATLDPTMRAIKLPGTSQGAILTDTVGFISNLPTHLVESFKATLEETQEADIILHVRDISHPHTEQQKEDVESVLKSLNINTQDENSHNIIEVWNKLDLLSDEDLITHRNISENQEKVCLCSALTGEGENRLFQAIDSYLQRSKKPFQIEVPSSNGKAISWIHQHGDVTGIESRETLMIFNVMMDPAAIDKLIKMNPKLSAREIQVRPS